MMTTDTTLSNWLAVAASAAGYDSARLTEVEASTPLAEAWRLVASSCSVSEDELADIVAGHFGLRRANFGVADRRPIRLVPEKVARKYLVLPLREDDRFLVTATSDPRDLEMEEALQFASGRTPQFEIATPTELERQIEEKYAGTETLAALLSTLGGGAAGTVRVLGDELPESVLERETESEPVVQLTDFIFSAAINEGASDIHIEPSGTGGTVRMRIDGVLRNYIKLPQIALSRVISRIKIMGRLDIADRLRPHDGRTRVLVAGQSYDLRISTVPTRDSEKAVIRILNPGAASGLGDLSLPDHELARLRQLFTRRDGVVLITGPTGSGKTTTIYSAIRELATGELNVMSVEDPVEYNVPGVTQIQVEPKRGVTFPSALRAILRQDPDVVFVGEIRDGETAEIAVQAAMTGHLVVATLHTNDAVGAVARMRDLGIDASVVASTLRGVVAQRLIRGVCVCSTPSSDELEPAEAELVETFGVRSVVSVKGCAQCGHSGYRGRFAIAEVLVTDDAIETLIASGGSASEVERAAHQEGMRSMLDVALESVREGRTTLAEVARVLGEGNSRSTTGRSEKPYSDAETVLVVEDDAINRRVVRSLLEKNGFVAAEAPDGVVALGLVESQQQFAAVVLDLDMPRMGGELVLQRLKTAPSTASVPVIVLTASGDEHAEARLIEAGADDYIRKPLDPSRFMARIRAAIRRAAQ